MLEKMEDRPFDKHIMNEKETTNWHALSLSDVFERLQCRETGLTSVIAAKRLNIYGENNLPRAKLSSPFLLFIRQFRNPLVYLLLAATVISLLINQLFDATFIFIVLLFNAIMGATQEWQAQKNAAGLDQLVPRRSIVVRDAQQYEIAAEQLVPGDVVKLESGVNVAADMRLLSEQGLRIDESLLTGESVSVEKSSDAIAAENAPTGDRINMLYTGTTVLSGRATGLVVETGIRTKVGLIAKELLIVDDQPPLVRQLNNFVRQIGWATVLLIGLIAITQFAQGTPIATVLLVAIALAVAAIPEGLPVAITIALSIATKRMQQCKVIVRSLPSVEGLGACTMIASDKTGTFTRNEMTLEAILPYRDGKPANIINIADQPIDPVVQNEILQIATSVAHCNEADVHTENDTPIYLGDSVDIALIKFAEKMGINVHNLYETTVEVATIPYESERRYAATFTQDIATAEKATVDIYAKGAAEVIAPLCHGIDPKEIYAQVDRLADKGYRVLAVASGQTKNDPSQMYNEATLQDLQFLGLIGLIDPIRPEVPQAIDECRMAGIHVTMITGDHPATALSIARQLNIAKTIDDIGTGPELHSLANDPAMLDRYVADKYVFARVEPLQKLLIVQSFQRLGHVVAVTGDGVNDAPALKAADIGVAMGRGGTDVARSAADLILTDDNFASIVAGIREGRIAYSNIRKLVYLLISTGLAEIVLFILAIAFALPIPLFAAQLLWLNLVTNGIQDIALAFEKGRPDIHKDKPRPRVERIFNRQMIGQVLTAGIYMGVAAFAAYSWFLWQGMDESDARNLLLLLMVLFENAHAMNARSESRSVFRIPFSANWFLISAVITAQAVHISAMFFPGLASVLRIKPVGIGEWLLIAALAGSLIVVMEIYKLLSRRL